MEPETENFKNSGWSGPVKLLTKSETRIISNYMLELQRTGVASSGKELATVDRVIFDLAADARIHDILVPLIGDNIFVWGALSIGRAPGESHLWHTDIETADSLGNAVTIWIALENASSQSSLNFISGSHLIGKSLQQVAAENGVSRKERTAEVSLELAKTLSPKCTLVQPEVSDGEALVFDGRTWHGSLNTREAGTRRALLLQYATPGFKIKSPDWSQLDWPFEFKPAPRCPVVMVSGKNSGRLNRVVPPPPVRPEASRALRSLSEPIPQPLPRNPATGWRPSHFYRGSTPVLRHLSCHASMLEPGCTPHPPHNHLDEEILVILEGEADIVIADSEDDPDPRIEQMRSGDMVYYPSYQFHTIRCSGESPVSYFMYRWNAPVRPNAEVLGLTIYRGLKTKVLDTGKQFDTALVLEGRTGLLDLLHVHLSEAKPGGGYAEHQDKHDVALLLFEGTVKTMGRDVKAPAVVLYPAMSLHGLSGAGTTPARYMVVEFHGAHSSPPSLLESALWRKNLIVKDLKARVAWRLNRLRSRVNR
jgi:mannose-6-phosphate isomerase-like protein (cupin superfamily)